jgi:small subunit ribosomal protein S16
MVKIRLTRTGKKNEASYRIVISPAREKRESDFIEYIGNYSPLTKELNIKEERAKYWLSVGAQPTDTVKRLLGKKNIIEIKEKKSDFKKVPGKQAADRAEKKSAKKAE